MENDTLDRVRAILVDHLGVEAEKVRPDSSLEADLGADSLDMVELVMAVEEEFDVEITDEEIETVVTVDDAVKLINKHR